MLTGERYKTISKYTAGVLKGEYGATMVPANTELQLRVLNSKEAIICRPAHLIEDELEVFTNELTNMTKKEYIPIADNFVDDVLIFALFPQIGLKFLKNKINPRRIRTIPGQDLRLASSTGVLAESTNDVAKAYSVSVNGQVFEVEVAQNFELTSVQAAHLAIGQVLDSPLAGNISKYCLETAMESLLWKP